MDEECSHSEEEESDVGLMEIEDNDDEFGTSEEGDLKPHSGDQDLGYLARFSAKTSSIVEDTGSTPNPTMGASNISKKDPGNLKSEGYEATILLFNHPSSISENPQAVKPQRSALRHRTRRRLRRHRWKQIRWGVTSGHNFPLVIHLSAEQREPNRKRPISWPDNRIKILDHNVPHTKLAVVKRHQNWVKVTGEYLAFPGGGTQFKHGALHYVDFVQETLPDIAWGKRSRVVLEVGCGVASFGGYLFDRDVITTSFSPKDEHEAQVQFALERGIPALFAARELLVDKFHFSGSATYGKGAIMVRNGDTNFLGSIG
ncbi:probable methyltransferase PMT28 [Aristolochia californica]|uniref:probable methyltransferase PMT28 n=1 Tax=Aristolochia californica TaxID=171875 RepID=UPI0035DE42DB